MQELNTMPYATGLDCSSTAQQTDEINLLKTTATLVLGTSLSLIQGVSLDAADDTRTAHIPIYKDTRTSEEISTKPEIQNIASETIKTYVKNAINNAKYEVFESGRESSFSCSINSIVALYGQNAINTISTSLDKNKLSEDIIVEAIRSLGAVNHSYTKVDRFKAILPYLNHKSPIVRDAAALAFADLGDKGAISFLKQAAEHEKFSAVRDSFLSVAKELEEAQV